MHHLARRTLQNSLPMPLQISRDSRAAKVASWQKPRLWPALKGNTYWVELSGLTGLREVWGLGKSNFQKW